MGTVTIRNLDDKVIKRLKARAKTHRRSLEAELRDLLAYLATLDIRAAEGKESK